MFEYVPEGMTIKAFRDHPIRRMLGLCTNGTKALPTKDEIDELGLDAATASKLNAACLRVARCKDDPDMDAVYVPPGHVAAQAAGKIIASLPEHQKNPDWFSRPDDTAINRMSPPELAAHVKQNAGRMISQ